MSSPNRSITTEKCVRENDKAFLHASDHEYDRQDGLLTWLIGHPLRGSLTLEELMEEHRMGMDAWSFPTTVSIHGPATVLRAGKPVEDPQILRRFDGLVLVDEDVADGPVDPRIDADLSEALKAGGSIALQFDGSTKTLSVVTVYETQWSLRKEELSDLVENTRGRWAEAVGGGLAFKSPKLRSYTVGLPPAQDATDVSPYPGLNVDVSPWSCCRDCRARYDSIYRNSRP
jgi:hypothetical protein